MILYNPTNGATIKDIYYNSVKYFVEKDNEAFKAGSLMEVEDEIGKFVLSLYGFIEEVSEKKAALIMKELDKQLKCEDCDYRTDNEESLKMHNATHKSKTTIKSKLGLKVIGKKEREIKKGQFEEEYNRQNEIEADNRKEGLDIGEGLQTEHLEV